MANGVEEFRQDQPGSRAGQRAMADLFRSGILLKNAAIGAATPELAPRRQDSISKPRKSHQRRRNISRGKVCCVRTAGESAAIPGRELVPGVLTRASFRRHSGGLCYEL
jgi:hypothetical protein